MPMFEYAFLGGNQMTAESSLPDLAKQKVLRDWQIDQFVGLVLGILLGVHSPVGPSKWRFQLDEHKEEDLPRLRYEEK